MSNTTTEILDRDCAAVTFEGARGGTNQIIVHFRRGRPHYGFGEKGALSGFLKIDRVPPHVIVAAREALDIHV